MAAIPMTPATSPCTICFRKELAPLNCIRPAVGYLVKILSLLFAAFVLGAPVTAFAHVYVIPSPTHEQTFAYGSERRQAWVTRGPDRHLALTTEFTNDPYVDRTNPRQYDDFIFDFPRIQLGADGRTFYYHASNGRAVPVAQRYSGFLGLDEVRLLDHTVLFMKQPHGYLTLALVVDENRHTPSQKASL